MPGVAHCPYCGAGRDRLARGTDGFIEMGEYRPSFGRGYESEGEAEGYRCIDCGGEFWANGPDMPDVKVD